MIIQAVGFAIQLVSVAVSAADVTPTVTAVGTRGFQHLRSMEGAVELAANENISGVRRSDGTIGVWGTSFYFQMERFPASIGTVKKLKLSKTQVIVLRDDGTVLQWGYTSSHPQQPPDLAGVVDIESNFKSTLVILADGSLVGWGNNQSGQVTPPPDLGPVKHVPILVPPLRLRRTIGRHTPSLLTERCDPGVGSASRIRRLA
jgi:alpha-tubulin suppressor-like RCC1 family protein